MDPESVPSGFITTRDGRVGRQTQTILGDGYHLSQSIPRISCERAPVDALAQLRRKTHLPLPSSEFDRHQQSIAGGCSRLLTLGRACHLSLLSGCRSSKGA